MDTVLTVELHAIHRRIRSLQQAFHSIGYFGQCRYAYRGGEAVGGTSIGQKDESGDAIAEPAGHRARAIDSGFGQDDGEFVAAVSGDDVGLAGAPADDAGGFDEGPAPLQVAVNVVDGFEPIKIDEDERQLRAASPQAPARQSTIRNPAVAATT